MHVAELIRQGLLGRWVSGLGCGVAALLVLTSAATTFGGERRVATVDHPATVAVTPESDATPLACESCTDDQDATLKLRLRPLRDAAGHIVRVFLDKPDADITTSTEDPAYVGSLMFSTADHSYSQDFALPLQDQFRSDPPHHVTIVVVSMDRSQSLAEGVLVEGVSLTGF